MSHSPEHLPAADGEDGCFRVLVVDDEPTLRLGFSYALRSPTLTVDTAANGRSALERITANRYDAIILDFRMPEIDGLSVIQALRAQGHTLPVILCSAALPPKTLLAAIRCNVVDFLLKPVRPAELREIVHRLQHPSEEPFDQALQAARRGNIPQALHLLSSIKPPSPPITSWLNILSSLSEDSEITQEKIRRAYTSIVFQPSPP